MGVTETTILTTENKPTTHLKIKPAMKKMAPVSDNSLEDRKKLLLLEIEMHERENVQRREILELEAMKKKIFTEKKLLQSEIDEKIANECDNEHKQEDEDEEEEDEEEADEEEEEEDEKEVLQDSSDSESEEDSSDDKEEDEAKSNGIFSKYTLNASPRQEPQEVSPNVDHN